MEITLEDMTVNAASTETITEPTTGSEIVDEITIEQEPKTEVPKTENALPSENEIYTPDLTFEVKGEKKNFPDWLKDAVKTKEHEQELRDYFTKSHGIEAIKESRTKIESEFNNYKTQIETQVAPTLNKISEFDYAVKTKDFSKAFNLAEINPTDVVDFMLSDDKLSDAVFKKVHEILSLEEQGPQAIQAYKQSQITNQEKAKLQTENEKLSYQLKQIEVQNFNSMLDFSLNQHANAMNAYDANKGQGAFEQLVRQIGHARYLSGDKVQPSQLVSEVASMIGFQPSTAPQVPVVNQVVQQQTPIQQKPVLPNLGTGSNQSIVKQNANTWDAWKNQMEKASQETNY